MGRGTTAYIRKVETESNRDKLIQLLKSTAEQNQIDFNKDKKGNRGFVESNDFNNELFIQLAEPPILKLKYAYYDKRRNRDPSSSEEFRYDYNDFDLWFDIKHRIIMFFTSNRTIAALVMKIIGNDVNLTFTPYSEPFFKWIEKEYKPQPSFRLLVVNGTYLDSLKNDEYTDSLSITTHEELSKSPQYQLVENDGDRKYFQGIFKLKDTQYKAKVYKNGKITVDKQVQGVKEDTKLILPWIYEDTVNINNYWKSLKLSN